VADVHRILVDGGIYSLPPRCSSRWQARLTYECARSASCWSRLAAAPIPDGADLDIEPKRHSRTGSLAIGSVTTSCFRKFFFGSSGSNGMSEVTTAMNVSKETEKKILVIRPS